MGAFQSLSHVLAEFFNPNDLTSRAASHGAVCGRFVKFRAARAAQVIWVDQIERSVRRHRLAHRQSGNAFGDTDFNERLAALGPALQRRMFGRGVLRDERAQSQPRVNRMSQSLDALARILAGSIPIRTADSAPRISILRAPTRREQQNLFELLRDD